MAQVLVVDDEPGISRFLRQALTRHGYAVLLAADGDEALHLIDRNPVDLVVLDLMLPGLDGFEVLERLSGRHEGPQIVVLSAIGDVKCRVRCLTMGAADYLAKPFAVQELIARIEARLRDQPRRANEHWLHVGTVSLDLQRHELVIDGEMVSLSQREFALLEHLMRHPGVVCPRSELLGVVWGWSDDAECSNVVDVYVRRVRAKLQDGLIETVRNVGYSFVAS